MSDLSGSRQEVAERIGVDVRTIDALVDAGRIPHVRLGPNSLRFPWKAIEEWLDLTGWAAVTDATLINAIAERPILNGAGR